MGPGVAKYTVVFLVCVAAAVVTVITLVAVYGNPSTKIPIAPAWNPCGSGLSACATASATGTGGDMSGTGTGTGIAPPPSGLSGMGTATGIA